MIASNPPAFVREFRALGVHLVVAGRCVTCGVSCPVQSESRRRDQRPPHPTRSRMEAPDDQ